jgi:hypothetical protein
MERAYMPPAEPPPLEHDTWGAPHPKAAVAGSPARTAGFDPSPLLSFAFGTALPAPNPTLRARAGPGRHFGSASDRVVLAHRRSRLRRASQAIPTAGLGM